MKEMYMLESGKKIQPSKLQKVGAGLLWGAFISGVLFLVFALFCAVSLVMNGGAILDTILSMFPFLPIPFVLFFVGLLFTKQYQTKAKKFGTFGFLMAIVAYLLVMIMVVLIVLGFWG